MKRIILMTICIICILCIQANTIVLDLQTMKPTLKNVSTIPNFTMEEIDDTIKISISIRYLIIDTDENSTSTISIPGFVLNSIIGEPCYPIKIFNLPINDDMAYKAIPFSGDSVELPMTLKIVDTDEADAQSLLSTTTSSKNHDFELSNYWLPESSILISEPQYYRGYGFQQFQFNPVQYNHETHRIKIYRELKYDLIPTAISNNFFKINSSKSNKINIAENDLFFDNFVTRTKSCKNDSERYHSASSGNITTNPTQFGYLILTTRQHLAASSKFAKWKRLLGYDVKTITKSKSWTEEEIEQSIQNYKNNNPNFYYLLLIGDEKQIPGKSFKHFDYHKYGYYTSDFQYACFDGDTDITPDIYFGRIPASSNDESVAAINKIIAYEQNPPSDHQFYKSAFHASEFVDSEKNRELLPGEEARMFSYTSEEAALAMQNRCGFDITRIYVADANVSPKLWSRKYVGDNAEIPVYLQKNNFLWNGSGNDIISCINSKTGISYGLYRGHGSFESWSSQLQFESNDISKLTNLNKYPIIFSISCQTGAYDKDSICLAKRLLLANDVGASGVIAASEATYSGYNDLLTGFLLRSIWPNSLLMIYPKTVRANDDRFNNAIDESDNMINNYCYNLGNALNNATNCITPFFASFDTKMKLTKRIFHCFGDPSMEIRTETPQIIRDVTVSKDASGFIISGNSSNYKYGAMISVIDTVFNETIAYQELHTCKISALYPDRCKICISGRNIRPLIIKGSEGYDPRINPYFRNPEHFEEGHEVFIDINTGIYYDKPLDEDEFQNRKCFQEYENGDIIYELNEAVVYSDKWNRQYWHIPQSKITTDILVPAIPIVSLTVNKSADTDYNNIYIADCEYKCFNNIFCDFTGELESPYDDVTFNPNTPPRYIGFWPDALRVKLSDNHDGTLKLQFSPMQYDQEHHVLKVHNKILFKRGVNPSGINNINPDEENIEYFGIDGLPVKTPVKGELYIIRQNNSYTKIIF